MAGRAKRAARVFKGDPFMSTEIHPVDEMLPAPRLLALGLQHVLVMYAGAVAVPLIIGRALKLSPEDVAFLISADLFACGLACCRWRRRPTSGCSASMAR
jgi:xanthine/uracil permease